MAQDYPGPYDQRLPDGIVFVQLPLLTELCQVAFRVFCEEFLISIVCLVVRHLLSDVVVHQLDDRWPLIWVKRVAPGICDGDVDAVEYLVDIDPLDGAFHELVVRCDVIVNIDFSIVCDKQPQRLELVVKLFDVLFGSLVDIVVVDLIAGFCL